MSSRTLRMLLLAGMVAMAACGGSKEPTPSSSASDAPADKPASGAEGMASAAKGLEDMAKSMRDMAEAGGGKSVPPVSIETLQTAFPDFSGWTKGKATGTSATMPVAFTEAQVKYTKGDAEIEVKAIDTGLSQLLIAPYSMFIASGYQRQTESGYEKALTVAGNPGWEKWDKEQKNGEVNMLVAKRFVITIEGDGVPDTAVLHELAGKVNVAALAAAK